MGMIKKGKNPTGKILETSKKCKKCGKIAMIDKKSGAKEASKTKCNCGGDLIG